MMLFTWIVLGVVVLVVLAIVVSVLVAIGVELPRFGRAALGRRVPVFVQRAGLVEGPFTMTFEAGTLKAKDGTEYEVTEADAITIKRVGRARTMGFHVDAGTKRAVQWDTPAGTCTLPDGKYRWTPDFVNSELDMRPVTAWSAAIRMPWHVWLIHGAAGFGLGFLVLSLIGVARGVI